MELDDPFSKRHVSVVIVQNAPSDLLSDILGTLHAQAVCSISLTAGGTWGVSFPMPSNIKFNAVRRGTCWLLVEGQHAVQLQAGDCVLIAGSSFALASAPDTPTVSARQIFAADPLAANTGSGDDFSILGGSVKIDAAQGNMLAQALPPVLVIRGSSAASIAWLLGELDREWDSSAPGARLICNDLLRMIFVQALRTFLAQSPTQATGWLAGMADPRIARALEAMHADPAHSWSVEALAKRAGQSRSGFAALFRQRLGQSPMDYLTAWRMRLAAGALRDTDRPIADIGATLGYSSDSAFGTSFRRVQQVSPARYRREHRAAPPVASAD